MDKRVVIEALIGVVEEIAHGARSANTIELESDSAGGSLDSHGGLFEVNSLYNWPS
jgi:hypothetical protein